MNFESEEIQQEIRFNHFVAEQQMKDIRETNKDKYDLLCFGIELHVACGYTAESIAEKLKMPISLVKTALIAYYGGGEGMSISIKDYNKIKKLIWKNSK